MVNERAPRTVTGTYIKLGCQCGRWWTFQAGILRGYACPCGLPTRSIVEGWFSLRPEINVSSSGIDIRSRGDHISRISAKEIHISGLDINILGPRIVISGEKIDISAVRLRISGDGVEISGSEVRISAGMVIISGHRVKIRANKLQYPSHRTSILGTGVKIVVSPEEFAETSSEDTSSEDTSFDQESYRKRKQRSRGRSNPYSTPKPEHYRAYWEYGSEEESRSRARSSWGNGPQGKQERASDWWQRNGAAPKPKARDYRERGSGEESKSRRQQNKSQDPRSPRPEPKTKPSSMPNGKKVEAFVDFYGLLGVSPSCSQAEIEKAAKRKRIEVHPDRLIKEGMTPQELQAIDERAKMVGGAADTLLDPSKRRRYDAERWSRL
ncbi:MAG: hypothetical protein Q9202_002895 [Teloschistes flavicans]